MATLIRINSGLFTFAYKAHPSWLLPPPPTDVTPTISPLLCGSSCAGLLSVPEAHLSHQSLCGCCSLTGHIPQQPLLLP